ncbi:MAG TPA: hypothetical protein VF384_16290 [Planctomycetota bacterium]
MKAMLWLPPAIAATLLLTCHAISQQTIQVPQQQPTIEAAFAAAADGDRIQLTQGNYTIGVNGLTLAKSLVVETLGSARATISYPDIPLSGPVTPGFPALRITGFGTGARIVLRNVTFDGGYSPWAWSPQRSAVIDVQLPNAVGELVLEGVEAIGEQRHYDDSCPGLRLTSGPSVRVMLRNCRFEGATGQSPFFSPGDVEYEGSDGAIVAAQGPFAAEACRFVGGAGGRSQWTAMGPFVPGRNGGAAAQLSAPLGSIKLCELVEGIPGAAYASSIPVTQPNPCTMYGASGASTLTTEVYDCTRTFTLPGCGQTPQQTSLSPGRNDVEPIPPASVGVPFPITFRPLPPANGLTLWIFGSGLESLAFPGIAGRLYVENAFLVGLVPPPGPTGWSQITFPAPPAALPFLSSFAVQLLHLDSSGQLQLGAVSTFTVLVP